MTTIRPAIDAAVRRVIAERTEALFRASGAFREGHFLLKSGRHGDAYVEKFAVRCRGRGFESYRALVGTAMPQHTGAPSAKGVEYRP